MNTRIKSTARQHPVPQSREECAAAIRQLGDLQRMHERQRCEMNDLIAAITQDHQPILQDLADQVEALRAAVQTWCEANRVALCGEGDKYGKTASLVTGEVAWRQRPPSVRVRGEEEVIQALQEMGLQRLLRVKTELDKPAILAEPETVAAVRGITIVTGVEDFIVTPFEANPATPGVPA